MRTNENYRACWNMVPLLIAALLVVSAAGNLSAQGVWTQAAASAPWAARHTHASTVFNEKMWILGGVGSAGLRNDVWSSPDGVNWTPETFYAPWSARKDHKAVAFDGRIWVIGGWDLSGRRSDVWSSTDGVSWVQETAAAQWSARSGSAAVVFNNKMWVLGGYDSSGWRNDVWSSSDGATWVEETPAAAWSARSGHAAVEISGQVWIMGGNDGSNLNDIWFTFDGVNWIPDLVVSGPVWSARNSHAAVATPFDVWVSGGRSGTLERDFWSSTGGGVWNEETSQAPWSARMLHAMLYFGNRMWILGGQLTGSSAHNGPPANDIWFYEEDGPPQVASAAPTTATAGNQVNYDVVAFGSPTPSISASGLPPWLSLNGSTLSGTPTASDIGMTGTITVTATNTYGVDDQMFQINVSGAPPQFTSQPATVAFAGVLYSYTAATTGVPAPAFSATGLPGWLNFNTATGELTGTPAATDIGTGAGITISATNGWQPDGQVNFQLTVEGQRPQITSAPVTTATAGTTYSYIVTASGIPAPALSATTLPGWLSFDPGTGELSGVPGSGDIGPANVEISADNGWPPATVQPFQIDVLGAPPLITSTPPPTATVGQLYVYSIQAAGAPGPSFSTNTLPTWLTRNGGALNGTPSIADIGMTGDIEITATNGWPPDDMQVFRIEVQGVPPTFTSTPESTAVPTRTYSYKAEATGIPAPALSVSGSLPSWLSFDAPSGVLSGTPPTGDANSSVNVVLVAQNGATPNGEQAFIINIGRVPGTEINGGTGSSGCADPAGGGTPVWLAALALLALASKRLRQRQPGC